jgi:hypothetical protein
MGDSTKIYGMNSWCTTSYRLMMVRQTKHLLDIVATAFDEINMCSQ